MDISFFSVHLVTILILLLLTIVAVVLYLTEIYFIPGIGMSGVLGAALSLAVLYYAFLKSPLLAVSLLLFGVLLFILGFYLLSKSKFIEKNALDKTIYGQSPNKYAEIQVGMTGTTLSRLTLSGNIRIGDQTIEATSDEGFIEEGKNVRVVRIVGNKIYVNTL